jgi:hypothetical protein
MLDIISIMQSIDSMGGFSLTQSGTVRVSDLRKFNKAMGWSDVTRFDEFKFPEPATAFISTLRKAGLLDFDKSGDSLELTRTLEEISETALEQLINSLLWGIAGSHEWIERCGEPWLSSCSNYSYARFAVLAALCALPDGDNFYRIDDFEKALFERIGEYFHLGYSTPSRPYYRSGDDRYKLETEWREKLRASWLDRERKWLDAAFTSWLYALGIVELHVVGHLRNEDFGRH